MYFELVTYDFVTYRIVFIPKGSTDGIWFVYEMETYMKLYYLFLVVNKIPMDNSPSFWGKFSKQLKDFGVWRDASSCKAKEVDFAKDYSELRNKRNPISGLDRLVFHVMSSCAHLNPPALGSVSGVRTSNGKKDISSMFTS